MIKDLFVPYTQALELKELGFDEPCFGRYYYKESYPMLNLQSGQTELVFEFGQYLKQTEVTILTPTFAQVFRWFREKHFILYDIVFYREDKRTKKGYWYNIFQWNFDMTKRNIINVNLYFTTYEEAELACLKKLIEIVKNM